MERLTISEYNLLPDDWKCIWHAYFGQHRGLLCLMSLFLPGHGTTLFIEGVSVEIVDDPT